MPRSVHYCETDDFLALLTDRDKLDLTDDDGDNEPDDLVLEAVRDAADNEIDSFYAIRGVPTPLDVAVEKGLVVYSKFLCVAHLYARRHLSADRSGHGEMIKTVRQLLTKIAEGKMDVPSLKPSTGGGGGSGGVPGAGSVVDVVSEEALTVPRRNRVFS